ncbi:MAG: BTAD domain-containing putative transcriptional regulator [Gemmatimonadaceae bacterium]
MVELSTLGILDLRRADGTAIQSVLQQPKRTALLAYLAISNSSSYQRRDTLMALFWPESGKDSARHSLSQAVYMLRQALGSDAILTRGDEEISVAPGAVDCDAAAFQTAAKECRYADALELYSGDFLTGLHLDGASEFERWVDTTRDALRQLAGHAAWTLAEQQLRRGAVVEAQRSAKRAVNLGPADEDEARRFLRRLAEVGETVAAVSLYEHLKNVLARELELKPSEETQKVIESIRQGVRTSRKPIDPLTMTRESGETESNDSEAVAAAADRAFPETKDSESPISSPTKALDAQPSDPRLARSRARASLAAAAVVLGALTVISWVERRSSEPTTHITSLAVLPLDNLTRDSRQDYFVDGMYNGLIGELAQISALRVISSSSASRFAGTDASIAEIARELKVDAILKGGVMRRGDSVGVMVQLIAASPERELWSGSYTRNLRDVLSLHDEVARAIATEIEVRLTARERQHIGGARRVDPAAYDAWLAGTYHASRRSGGDLDACFHFARRAVAADPGYAPAYELLAECYNIGTFVNTSFPGEMFEESKRAARHALELDETLASAHATLAYAKAHYDWDWESAEQSYRRALQMNPTLESAEEDLAWLLSWAGRFDEALSHARKAKQLEPFSPQASLRVAMILHLARRDDESIAEANHAIELDSAFMFAYDRLHWAYYGKRQHGAALAAAKRAVALSGPGDVRRQAFLAHAYAMNGQRTEARALVGQLLKLQHETYVPPTAIAIAYLGLGEKEKALDWLERGYDGRDGDMVLLKVFPVWDPLRDDPRYRALLRKMRFPA